MKTRLALLLFTPVAAVLFAAGTTTWEMNNFSDFVRGRFSGVSLSRDGRLRLAPRLDTLFASDQPVVWSVVRAPDGSLYAGTGHRGRVFRIDPSGKGSVIWTADQPEVFAVALDAKGTLYAATSPNGKVYRIVNGEAVEFFAPQTTYIWSLAFAPDGSLFVGTGDQGTIFRVDPSGRGEVYYETGQAHVTSLAFDVKGRLLAGTEPNGILYRVEAKDRASVLYDSTLAEIRAIRVAPDGVIYAAAQGGAGLRRALAPPAAPTGTTGPAPASTTTVTTVTVTDDAAQGGLDLPKTDASKPAQPQTPQVTTQFAPVSEFPGVEKSALYKIAPDNLVETIWSSKEENIYDFVAAGDQILLATDAMARVYRLSPDGKATLLAQLNEGEATRLIESPEGIVVATGNLGKLFRLGEQPGVSGFFESPVHDAGNVARWGRLSWLAELCSGCRLAFRTRSGNSLRPDRTWSDWSAPLEDPSGSPITSPNARYIQWRAEFSGSAGQTPVLDSVTLAYLPQNTPPIVKNISVSAQASASSTSTLKATTSQAVSSSYSVTVTDSYDTGPTTSAGTPTQAVGRSATRQLTINWQAEDQDGDRLTYALYFRGEGEREWKLIKENLTETTYTIDGDVLADGKYFFKVTASDLPGNTLATARQAELVSHPILIDNTPPLISHVATKRTGDAVLIEFDAQDATSMLRRAEYSLDAGPWIPAEAADGILDAKSERILIRIKNLTPGEHLVALRVMDAAENAGLGKVVLQ